LRQKVTTGVVFQEYFNTSLQSNFGNLFFDIDDSELRNDEAGVRVISYESFDNYKNAETAKYYTSPNANVKISQFPEAGTFTDRTAYSYFTPSVVFDKYKEPQKYNKFLSNETNK
jgi:hypothetical protein